MKVWGLTGGIASGKSLAAKVFSEKGVPVIDADQIARALNQPGTEARKEIEVRFGTADRAELRKIVFEDAAARKDLEAILHPKIQQESAKQLEVHQRAGKALAVYEAALLVEAGRHRDFDGLIVVTAPEDLRIHRLMQRDQVSERQARQIITAQMAESEKVKEADVVFVNDSDEAKLRLQVEAFLRDELPS